MENNIRERIIIHSQFSVEYKFKSYLLFAYISWIKVKIFARTMLFSATLMAFVWKEWMVQDIPDEFTPCWRASLCASITPHTRNISDWHFQMLPHSFTPTTIYFAIRRVRQYFPLVSSTTYIFRSSRAKPAGATDSDVWAQARMR